MWAEYARLTLLLYYWCETIIRHQATTSSSSSASISCPSFNQLDSKCRSPCFFSLFFTWLYIYEMASYAISNDLCSTTKQFSCIHDCCRFFFTPIFFCDVRILWIALIWILSSFEKYSQWYGISERNHL